jgi:hypothetical protein
MALIDPQPLTRSLIADLLAKALPDYAMVAASTCEELLETEGIGGPNLVVIYIRNEGLTNTWVQSALELLRVRLPEASGPRNTRRHRLYDIFIGVGSDRARNFIGAGLYADIVKQTPLSQWLASAPCLHAVTR